MAAPRTRSSAIVAILLALTCPTVAAAQASGAASAAGSAVAPAADRSTGEEATPSDDAYKAWWTGSLLAAPGRTIPPGHAWFGPTLSASRTYGTYQDPWSVRALDRRQQIDSVASSLNLGVGLLERLDFGLSVQGAYNVRDSKSSFAVGDTSAKLDYWLVRGRDGTAKPDVMLMVRETFPSGRCVRLNPERLSTDAGGTGSFATAVGVNAQKLLLLSNGHLLKLRVNVAYRVSTGVPIHDYSGYGTGEGAEGTARPGNGLSAVLAAEYHLTESWVLAFDVAHSHADRTTFEGYAGTTRDGSVPSTGHPSSEQLSVAPAVEYNFSGHVGLLAGVWTTLVGRNDVAFVSPQLALSTFY